MAEYIEREALSEYFREKFEYYKSESEIKVCGRYMYDEKMQYAAIVAKHFLDELKRTPIADVVEVVHGKWLQTKEPLGANEVDCVECSVCRESWVIEEDLSLDEYIEFWHYCPNCGAKMDGDTNE